MRVSVVIPYRESPNRGRLLDHVLARYRSILPDAEILTSDSGHEPFSRAASRNWGVRRAAGEVVVVGDADSVPDEEPLLEAIQDARQSGAVHWPFDRCVYLTEQETELALEGKPFVPSRKKGNATGGLVVASRDTWIRIGGQDEKFRGWGGEDDAFHMMCRRTVGAVRHEGLLVALWHPNPHRFGEHHAANRRRLDHYRKASTPDQLFSLNGGIRMEPTRYLILCAGDGTRWGDRFGGPKHFAPLRGEPILHRTIRQLTELDPDSEIFLVVKDMADDRYQISGTERVEADLSPNHFGGVDKVVSARHAWNQEGRTVLLFGDVYYTTKGITRIVSHHTGDWAFFGRPRYSTVTGKKWNEPFAIVFWPEHIAMALEAAERTARLWRDGVAPHIDASRWFRAAAGVPDSEVGKWSTHPEQLGHWETIDDATDDFDAPKEWDEWCLRYAKATPEERERLWV